MVSPSRRRDAVRYVVRRHKTSERRACRLVSQHRSSQRYRRLQPQYEQRLVGRMNDLAAAHARYGYRRIWALLGAEGFQVNRKRIERLWRLKGPGCRRRRPFGRLTSSGRSASRLRRRKSAAC
jgi:putative transposase